MEAMPKKLWMLRVTTGTGEGQFVPSGLGNGSIDEYVCYTNLRDARSAARYHRAHYDIDCEPVQVVDREA